MTYIVVSDVDLLHHLDDCFFVWYLGQGEGKSEIEGNKVGVV
jgi:hypothetical protein